MSRLAFPIGRLEALTASFIGSRVATAASTATSPVDFTEARGWPPHIDPPSVLHIARHLRCEPPAATRPDGRPLATRRSGSLASDRDVARHVSRGFAASSASAAGLGNAGRAGDDGHHVTPRDRESDLAKHVLYRGPWLLMFRTLVRFKAGTRGAGR